MEEIKGWFSYKGITTLQHENIEAPFRKLFEETRPSQLLEIGTSYGGLTVFLRDLLDDVGLEHSILRSYDILDMDRSFLYDSVNNKSRMEIYSKNLFDNMYFNLYEVEEATEFIQRNGVTVVLCDGGSKKNEVNILTPLLKPGDIIMAHDYAPNSTYFETYIKDKIWSWCEIQDSDIEETVNQYNLQPFHQEEFLQVVWMCKVKV